MKTKLFIGAFSWICLLQQQAQSQTFWEFGGNGTVGATDYIGSTNTASFRIITNNTPKVIVLGNTGATDGYVGIGTTSPSSVLHIDGTGTTTPTGEVFRTATSTSVNSTWKMYSGGTEMFRIENVGGSNGIKLMGMSTGGMRLYSQNMQRIHIEPGAKLLVQKQLFTITTMLHFQVNACNYRSYFFTGAKYDAYMLFV